MFRSKNETPSKVEREKVIWLIIISFALAPIKIQNSEMRSELRNFAKHEKIKEYEHKLDLAQSLLEVVMRESEHDDKDGLDATLRILDNIAKLLDSIDASIMTQKQFERWKKIYFWHDNYESFIVDKLSKLNRSEMRLRESA